MKKALLLFIPFLFLSCFSYFSIETTFINNSTKVISFNYGNKDITLSPLETYSHTFDNYFNIGLKNPFERVYYDCNYLDRNTITYTFKNIEPYFYEVHNTLTTTIYLSENKYIGDPAVEKIKIDPDEIVEIAIYSSSPIFSAIDVRDNTPININLISIIKK